MKIGTIPLADWKQPNSVILRPIAMIANIFFPSDSIWDSPETLTKSPTLFLGNANTFSFDTIALQSQIYLKTSQWPRAILPSVHFQIPIWKHVIEIFGCVENSPTIVSELSLLERSFIYCPVDDSDDLKLKGFQIIPFASIGASDMVPTSLRFDIRLKSFTRFHTTPNLPQRQFQSLYL